MEEDAGGDVKDELAVPSFAPGVDTSVGDQEMEEEAATEPAASATEDGDQVMEEEARPTADARSSADVTMEEQPTGDASAPHLGTAKGDGVDADATITTEAPPRQSESTPISATQAGFGLWKAL